MNEKPILTPDELIPIIRQIYGRNGLIWPSNLATFAAALQSDLLEKLRGEPVAWLVAVQGCDPQFVRDREFLVSLEKRGVLFECVPLFTLPTEQD